MAALGLTMSALPAQSADVQITTLPFLITAPGTYVVNSDLTITGGFPAISLAPSVSTGKIIINLNGHTVIAPVPPEEKGAFFAVVNDTSSSYVLVIKNGYIHGFSTGIAMISPEYNGATL